MTEALVLHSTQTNLGNQVRFGETDTSLSVKIKKGVGWVSKVRDVVEGPCGEKMKRKGGDNASAYKQADDTVARCCSPENSLGLTRVVYI